MVSLPKFLLYEDLSSLQLLPTRSIFLTMKLSSITAVAAVCATTFGQTCPSSAVSKLVTDLQKVGTDCDATAALLNAFTISQGVAGALAIQATEGAIETDLKTALTDGAAITATDSCNGAAVASAITGVVPHITAILSALVNQASNVASLGVQYLVTGDLTNLQTETAQLEALAYSKLPCGNIPAAKSAFSTINAAFSSALSVYAVAQPTPWPNAPSC